MSTAEIIPLAAHPTEDRCELVDEVAARIREWRKVRKLTLKDVADRISSSPQTVQRLETGNMTLSVEWIAKLAAALKVEPVEFFRPGGENEAIHQIHQDAERRARASVAAYMRRHADALEQIPVLPFPGRQG